MKTKLLASVATVATLLAAPALAGGLSGVVGGSISSTDIDSCCEYDSNTIGGSVNVDFDNGWNLQLDAQEWSIESVSFDTLGAHVYHRGERASFGGFFMRDHFDSTALNRFGLEGELYMERFTLGAFVGMGKMEDDGFSSDLESQEMGVYADFFATDNLSFSLGYRNDEFDPELGSEFDMDTLNVGGEWSFDAAPVSLFLDYSMADGDGFEADTWTLGARYRFGGVDSPMAQDRSGATWKARSPIFIFGL
jgi:hypothetical protein